MDLHSLMSPYADGGSPRAAMVDTPGGRHRADGPAPERLDAWGHEREPRHRAERHADGSDVLTSV
jgi:hypothetical protein